MSADAARHSCVKNTPQRICSQSENGEANAFAHYHYYHMQLQSKFYEGQTLSLQLTVFHKWIVNTLLIVAFRWINTLNSLYFLIKRSTDLLLKHCLSLSNRGKNIAASE